MAQKGPTNCDKETEEEVAPLSPATIRVKHGDFRHMNLWMKSTSVCSFCHKWWNIMAQVDDMS